MTTFKKRSQSLEYSVHNSKRNWFQSIFLGFGSSKQRKKRDKSEKSAYSQTEDNNLLCHNETGTQYSDHKCSSLANSLSSEASESLLSNDVIKEYESSNKLFHKYNHKLNRLMGNTGLTFSAFEGELSFTLNRIIDEFCCSIIKNETRKISLQRQKFEAELTKHYHKIYREDNVDKNVNSFCPEKIAKNITICDNFHRPFRTKCPLTNVTRSALYNESDSRQLSNISRRFTIKRCEGDQEIIDTNKVEQFLDCLNKSEKLGRSKITNEKGENADLCTVSCAISISTICASSISDQNSHSRHDSSHNDLLTVDHLADEVCNTSVIDIDVSNGTPTNLTKPDIHPELCRGDQKPNNAKKKKFRTNAIKKLKANNAFIKGRRDIKSVDQRQNASSLILDVEEFRRQEDQQISSIKSEHTFSDFINFSTNEEFSPIKGKTFRSPIQISISWSNAQNMTSQSQTPNIENSNMSNSTVFPLNESKKDESNIERCYAGQNFNNQKFVSTKYNHVTDHFVTLTETLSNPYGTLCEILSEDCTLTSDNSFHPTCSTVLETSKVMTRKTVKSNSTFLKHTISSKLKMKCGR